MDGRSSRIQTRSEFCFGRMASQNPRLFEALVHGGEKNWVRMRFFFSFLSGFGMDGRDGWMGGRKE